MTGSRQINVTVSLPLLTVLTGMLIVAKLFGADISWLWVWAPFWILPAIFFSVLAAIGAFGLAFCIFAALLVGIGAALDWLLDR